MLDERDADYILGSAVTPHELALKPVREGAGHRVVVSPLLHVPPRDIGHEDIGEHFAIEILVLAQQASQLVKARRDPPAEVNLASHVRILRGAAVKMRVGRT